MAFKGEETTFRGVAWRRDLDGRLAFRHPGNRRWVWWTPGDDAPPRPPGWGDGKLRPDRPGFLTPWRLIPVILAVGAVLVAIWQVESPSSNRASQETRAAEALLDKCLTTSGTLHGEPTYSRTPVACSSSKAAVKIIKVIPSYPPGQICPKGTTGVEIPFAGVKHPHILCAARARL